MISSAEEILKAAKKRKLHPVVFRGLAFERCIYGDVARRDVSDLDLLIRKEEAPAIHKLLLALGYQQQADPSSVAGACQSEAFTTTGTLQKTLGVSAGQVNPYPLLPV